MYSYYRLNSWPSSSSSPSHSPVCSPLLRRGKGKVGRFPVGICGPKGLLQRLTWILTYAIIQRQSVFLFAPVVYVALMLYYTNSLVPVIIDDRPVMGSVYRSHEVFANLWQEMLVDNSSLNAIHSIWKPPHKGGWWKPCISWTTQGDLPDSNGFLYVEANGGLNQQRTSICNAVAVAAYLNATLVLPNFHKHSVWRDPRVFFYNEIDATPCPVNNGVSTLCSLPRETPYLNLFRQFIVFFQRTVDISLFEPYANVKFHILLSRILLFLWKCLTYSSILNIADDSHGKFSDIYDEEHFIGSLRGTVRIVNKLPTYIMERYDFNMSKVLNFRIRAWSHIQYYKDVLLPRLLEEKAIRISPFANRLSVNAPPEIQKLRCLANYEALRFANPISTLAEILVKRMKKHSMVNDGKYVALHLRFEKDMVAFSCCVYDGGEKEKFDMNTTREKIWPGKFTKVNRIIRPGVIRHNGKCPLTPLEVGLMLRGMGFSNTTSIYLASGKIYDSKRTMGPLKQMFPLLQTKYTLALPQELAQFKKYSSRMAAIDYSVCLHSEVFVTTQGGNFPHFQIGHRRYLYNGHAKTIMPEKRKLVLLLSNPNIRWKTFKTQMSSMRSRANAKGVEARKPKNLIYTFPCPDCMCRLNKSVVP